MLTSKFFGNKRNEITQDVVITKIKRPETVSSINAPKQPLISKRSVDKSVRKHFKSQNIPLKPPLKRKKLEKGPPKLNFSDESDDNNSCDKPILSLDDYQIRVCKVNPESFASTLKDISVTTAQQVIKAANYKYTTFPSNEANSTPSTLSVTYPAYSFTEEYPLIRPKDKDDFDPVAELIRIVEITSLILPPKYSEEYRGKVERLVRSAVWKENKKNLETAIERHNHIIKTLRSNSIIQQHLESGKVFLTGRMLQHFLISAYSRTVGPYVQSLLNYRAWSSNVYGELLPPFLSRLFTDLELEKNSLFVDLGCGVGSCVLQAALEVGCESFGIEISPGPAKLAKTQLEEFKTRLRLFGIKAGSMSIVEGDMMANEETTRALQRADFVLVNNYAFEADLNNRLLGLFLELKDGANIVSLKSFIPLNHTVSERNLDNPASILTVEQKFFGPGSVSWSNFSGPFFISTIDRSRISKFLKLNS